MATACGTIRASIRYQAGLHVLDEDTRATMSAELRELFGYWEEQARRRGGALPHRNSMVALELAERCPAAMPHIWMLDVERDPWRFRFRMISRSIRLAVGTVPAGGYLSDLEGKQNWRPLYQAMVGLCEERQPDYRRGTPNIAALPELTEIERLSLPLAHDGRNVDVILSATLYRRADGSILH